MVKSTTYLERFDNIIRDLANEFDLEYEEVVEIIDHFFLTLKKFITDIRMPTIKVSMWGTFRPTIGRINWSIDNTLWHMSKDRGDRDKMFRKIRLIQMVKERLLDEKAGKSTWKLWRNKDIESEAESKE